MTLARHFILYFTKYTPLHRAVTARFLAEYVARMIVIGFEPCPALDPQSDPPIVWLEQMQRALPGTMRYPPHEGIDILRRLLRKGEELSPNLGDGLRDQAAAVWDCEDAGLAATSIPSVNLTP